MTAEITLATGPVSWGVDFADSSGNPPWRHVLDELRAAGLSAMELGPLGYLPEEPEVLRPELDSRQINVVGSFIFDDLHDPARAAGLIELTERTARWIAGVDGHVLVIIDRPGPERMATAGRSDAAPRLDQVRWSAMIDTIVRISEIAQSYGLIPVVHPHAGGYIEYQDEIEKLLHDTDLALCLDTGHLAYAGMNPQEAIDAYAERMRHIHLKDINSAVLDRVHRENLDFWNAIEAQVFCPLGSGMVDLKDVGAALGRASYHGFATIEQDRVPGSGAPLDDLRQCVGALRNARVGRETPSQ